MNNILNVIVCVLLFVSAINAQTNYEIEEKGCTCLCCLSCDAILKVICGGFYTYGSVFIIIILTICILIEIPIVLITVIGAISLTMDIICRS